MIPTPREFVARMVKASEVARAKGAIFNERAAVAQAALESEWGRSLLARKYNNLFGVKAFSTWTGERAPMLTKEYYGGKYVTVQSWWRVYPSYNECIVDYAQLIANVRWFKDAVPHADAPHGDGNAEGWIAALLPDPDRKELGWATGPKYLPKVRSCGVMLRRLGGPTW